MQAYIAAYLQVVGIAVGLWVALYLVTVLRGDVSGQQSLQSIPLVLADIIRIFIFGR